MQRLTLLMLTLVCVSAFSLCPAGEYPVEKWQAWHHEATDRYPQAIWLQYVNPEDAGWSAQGLQEAKEYFESIDAAAAMVVHDGAVLAAWGEVDRRFPCHSVRKSLLNAVYGVHVANGNIDLEKTLAEIGIDDNPPLSDSEKQARVVDLLRSRSAHSMPSRVSPAPDRTLPPARGHSLPPAHEPPVQPRAHPAERTRPSAVAPHTMRRPATCSCRSLRALGSRCSRVGRLTSAAVEGMMNCWPRTA